MSDYYKSQRDPKQCYNPKSFFPFVLSRSRIDSFLKCKRCFYLDRRLGVDTPPGYPFTLNSAVDYLLKLEFDIHRTKNTTHPLIEKYAIDARPVDHKELPLWRENFKGVRFHHKSTNLIITGAIDDLWINSKNEYIVVDYKATSKNEKITSLNKAWQDGYKRQIEIYQWLLKNNGLTVSKTAYFVYCNGITDKKAFDARLEFDITLIPYTGSIDWIEQTLHSIKECLDSNTLPVPNQECDFCCYRKAASKYE